MVENNLLLNKSDSLVKNIYKSTIEFPYKYQSSIGDQLRRSSLSIVLNIVEGGAQFRLKERARYLRISYASLKETKYLIYFANNFTLIEKDIYLKIKDDINQLARILYGLIRKNRQSIGK